MNNRYLIAFSQRKFSECERESEISVVDCMFQDLNHSKAHVFELVERDDGKGFGVTMRGVTVVPNTYLCINNAPVWLRWLVKLLDLRTSNDVSKIPININVHNIE